MSNTLYVVGSHLGGNCPPEAVFSDREEAKLYVAGRNIPITPLYLDFWATRQRGEQATLPDDMLNKVCVRDMCAGDNYYFNCYQVGVDENHKVWVNGAADLALDNTHFGDSNAHITFDELGRIIVTVPRDKLFTPEALSTAAQWMPVFKIKKFNF